VMADQRIQSQVAQLRAANPTLGIDQARAAVLAKGPKAYSWFTFQLAFVLMQLPLLTDPGADKRSGDLAKAQLLFFPTGGGKTEAYLGLAAYTFAIRRRHGIVTTPDGPLDGNSGVAVLMRYTLRLLTAQQFQRATALVCAAELARSKDEATWGTEPFRIGLWVGTDVSPKRYDEAEAYPEDSIRALIESGLYGIWVPEAYGGSAMGSLALAMVCEEIAAACASTGTQYLDQALGGIPILLAGSDEQKKRFLPPLATGEWLCAYSLSEPAAGSDAAGLRTTAVRRGDHYVLNGSKQWCTNGDHADVITVFATLDPAKRARGVTAFLVEKGTPGFSVGKKEKKMGIRASPTVSLHSTDCALPAANRLGAEVEGSTLAIPPPDPPRPATCALGLGIAQAALDAAVAYAKERQQFGQPIGAFQGIQFMLADMAMAVHASRLMIHHCARQVDAGITGNAYEASMAKCFAADTAMKVTTDAVQIFGGYGYIKEYPVEKLMRDAKLFQIYEGTSQIQRLVIAKEIFLPKE